MENVYSSEMSPIQNGMLLPRPGNGDGLCQEVVRPANREIQRERQKLALNMRLAGALQREIAEALGVSQQAVSRLLRRIDNLVVERMEADVSLVRRRQGLRLERLFDEAMRGWQWSLQARTTQETNLAIGGVAGMGSVRSELNETKPDPRFLAVALQVLASERRVWGLDWKSKFEPHHSSDLPEFLERELRRAYGKPAAEKQRDASGISTGSSIQTDQDGGP